jgi:excisionase family DNA binding protein
MFDDDYPILLSIQQAATKIGKSEKTIRRWIHDGKLQAEKHGAGGYLIKREDVTALTKHVTKEWQEQSDLAQIRLQYSLLEGQVEHLKLLVDAQQYEIEELQRQIKKLTPKKAPSRKKTTSTASTARARTSKRKRDEDRYF